MKHVIIGTAGHVDHGKTALVKALTGVDTDRLAEEKRRGLTIETGFARMDWPDGLCAGVVDVPGHEKFIKNMLAGAGGIDLAMLVVAADEGIMPQTVEHLDILSLLGVRSGLVVLTKCDLADDDWRALVRADIAARTEGTFLVGCPVVEVSSVTGQGIPELRRLLHGLVLGTEEKNVRAPFRLPIDRVFSVDGFGTVVTGTVVEGAVRSGDEVELAPGGARARVRGLQVHGQRVDAAYAGQRAALNLADLKKEEVRRGDAAVKPDSVRPTLLLDVRLRCLRDSARSIENGSRVHFCHGTSVQLARIVLLDADHLAPGESDLAQLRVTEPAAVKKGDRFVLRFYSPLETIGGGIVLDDAPVRHRRGDAAVLEALAVRESGSAAERALQGLAEFGTALPSLSALAARLGESEEELAPVLAGLLAAGRIAEPLAGRYIASAALDALWARTEALLTDYHAKNPLHTGMRAPELRQKLFGAADRTAADALLALLEGEGKLRRGSGRWALAGFAVRFTKRQLLLRDMLLERAPAEPVALETAEGILARFLPKDRAEARQVFESLTTGGEFVPVAQGMYLRRAAYEAVRTAVLAHFAAHEALTLAQLRDALGTSRDSALVILEFLDRSHVTQREGDLRRLDRGFSV